MAITNLGTANDPASVTGFSQVTAAAACPVGSTVLVIAADLVTSLSTTGVTDSQGNIYTLLRGGNQASIVAGGIYTSVITTALTTSDTIKYTARSGSIGTAISAALVTGQGTLDLNLTVATGNSAAPSSGTGTPSVDHELVIGAVVYNANAVTATQGPGFSSPPNSIADSATSPGIVAGSILDATATSTTYSPTLTVGRPYVAFLVSYFPSPAYPRDFVIRGVGVAAPFLTTPATLSLRQNPARDFAQAAIPGTAAVPFVITYSVPRAPVLSSYLLYFGQAMPAGAAPVVETNTHFLARAWPVSFNLLPLLRQNVVPPAGVLATQAETQPHFLGRHIAPAFARFRYNLTPQDTSVAAQPEAQPHFVPRHTSPKFSLLPLLIQNPAQDVVLQDSNTHFVADPWRIPSHTTSLSLRQNSAVDIPSAPSGPSIPASIVPFVITYAVPRAPVATSYLYYYTQPAPPVTGPAPIAETNTHFLGKFRQPQHNVLIGLRQNVVDGTSGPLPTQPETQPHYITRPWPISFSVLSGLRQNEARDLPILDSNPHFIGRFVQPVYARLPRLSNDDGTRGLQAETNVNFVAKFATPSYALPVNRYNTYARDASAQMPQPETNTHFVPRFTAPTYSLLALLRQNRDHGSGPLAIQPETQPHFVGRFTAPGFAQFRYNSTPEDSSVPPQPETNVHFIGKFTQPQHYILQALRQGVVPPAGPLATQPETQPHFLGRFTAPTFARFRYSFAPQDISIQPETNTNSIGRFAAVSHVVDRKLHQNIPFDTPTQPHPHFVPKFSQPQHIVLPGLRQTIAADISIQPETNVDHKPQFTAPSHVVSRSLYQFASRDVTPPQPETNTNFLGRFQQPQHSVLASLRRGEAMDNSGALAPQPETNTHFLGTFRQPNHQVLRDYRMSVPTDIIPPTATVSACVIYGRASYAIIYGDACGCD